MQGLTPFSIRFYPKQDEGLVGYLFRVGVENGLSGLPHVNELLADALNSKGLKAWLMTTEQVASSVGLSGINTRTFLMRPDGKGRFTYLHNENETHYLDSRSFDFAKVCPRCFASDGEQPYIRASWELESTYCCKKHSIMLVDSCQKCGRRIRWGRRYIARCSCGEPLENSPQEPLPSRYQIELIHNNACIENGGPVRPRVSNSWHDMRLGGKSWPFQRMDYFQIRQWMYQAYLRALEIVKNRNPGIGRFMKRPPHQITAWMHGEACNLIAAHLLNVHAKYLCYILDPNSMIFQYTYDSGLIRRIEEKIEEYACSYSARR